MNNTGNKTDNIGDTWAAKNFNALNNELENVVTDADQTLDPSLTVGGDLNQIGKSIALYGSASQYYSSTGSASAYILTRSTNLQDVPAYKNGMLILFQANHTNVGATTVNVSGLGVKDLVFDDSSVLQSNTILISSYVLAVYNLASDKFHLLVTSDSAREKIEIAITQFGDYSGDMFSRTTELFKWLTPSKLPDPATLPTVVGRTSAWSPNGEFLAVVSDSALAIIIYQKNGITLTKLADPAILPTSSGKSVSWSPNGEFLAVAHSSSPFLTIYQRSGTTFTKLPNPATLPDGIGQSCAFSPNGEFLSVGHSTSQFITIYQITGTTFTKLPDPATLPDGIVDGFSWSPNGEFLVCVHEGAVFITIYQRSGTTFTKLPDPATLPTGNGRGANFSPNGEFLAVAHDITPFLTVYQITGTTFTAIADVGTLPTGDGKGVAFSPNGEFLSVMHNTAPFMSNYQTSKDMPTNGIVSIKGIRRAGT